MERRQFTHGAEIPMNMETLGASLSEKRERVLMQCGLQNRQQGTTEVVRDHRYIKYEPARVYNIVYIVSVKVMCIWR